MKNIYEIIKMKRHLNIIVRMINNYNLWLLICLLILLNCMTIQLSGDEEFYLAISKKFLNNNWIPNSFNFDDVVGISTIFRLILGYL
jgi:hypothetical protein